MHVTKWRYDSNSTEKSNVGFVFYVDWFAASSSCLVWSTLKVFSYEVVLLPGAKFKRTKTERENDCLIQWPEGDETNPCPWELRVTVSSPRLKPMMREEDRPCPSPIASSWDDKRSSFQWSPNGDFICSFFVTMLYYISQLVRTLGLVNFAFRILL